MLQQKQLECRIVLTFMRDKRTALGMYAPLSCKYVPLGVHGPSVREVDKIVHDLKIAIERAGHLLTFCERSE